MNMKPNDHAPCAPARARGVTLIELMIVLVIMSILATTALSSYRSYVMRTNRTDARMTLLAIQVAQEKWFLQNNQYAQTVATVTAAPPAGLGIPLGAGGLTPNGNYLITFTTATATAYTVQAAATAAQASDTRCPTLAIDQNGTRTALSPDCWR